MYAMWWHKPLSPKEPFILRGERLKSLSAYMYMSSEMSGELHSQMIESQTKFKTLLALLRLYSKIPEMESMTFSATPTRETSSLAGQVTELDTNSCETIDGERALSDGWLSLQPSSQACLIGRLTRKGTANETAFFERLPRIKYTQNNAKSASRIALNRWRLATIAIHEYPIIEEKHSLSCHDGHQNECRHFRCQELVATRVQNWPRDDLLRSVNGLAVGMILWLTCLAYGSIHLTAWNDHFPTVAEKWLWRASSLYVGFCGGLWIVLNYITVSCKRLNAFWDNWMDGGGRWWQNIIIGTPVFVCGLSLVLARIFIVVEAFVSIRELPAEAYVTPGWTQVFPHF